MSRSSLWTRILKNKYFKIFSSVKFAIPVLFLFALAMIIGTIAESKYGTKFASSAIYQSWWFYCIQAGIALSVFLAMLARLPYKRRLSGFYIVHISLLTIIGGSVITHFYGVDASLELDRGRPANVLLMSDAVAHISIGDKQNGLSLPSTYKKTEIDKSILLPGGARISLGTYLPYAQPVDKWIPRPGAWTSIWRIKNDRVEQEIQLGNEKAGLETTKVDLGPLHLEVLDDSITQRLAQLLTGKHVGFVFLNSKTGRIRNIDNINKGISFDENGKHGELKLAQNLKIKMTFFEFKLGEKKYAFFPKFSSLPLTGHLESDTTSDYRLLDLNDFGQKNAVYVSPLPNGDVRLVYGKQKTWETKTVSLKNPDVFLPWMGFKLTLLDIKDNQGKIIEFVEAKPNKEEEKNIAALSVAVESGGKTEKLWMNNRELSHSSLSGADLVIAPNQFRLPFTMTLERFQMDMVPGTDRPASYESFVKVSDDRPDHDGEKHVHIFMNNPFKADGYTFYQSSYFQDEAGEYHSVLSVNKDPGRPIKYGGAVLLILGLILHFLIIYGKVKL